MGKKVTKRPPKRVAKKLVEEKTGYPFMRFWDDFAGKDEDWQEYDGGSYMKWGVRKDLKGLCTVAYHYAWLRGNRLDVPVRDLVALIAEKDKVFASRVGGYHASKYQEMMDMNAKEWTEKIYGGDKKLRALLGLRTE